MKFDSNFYNAISNWNRKKNIRNFIMVHKYGFVKRRSKPLIEYLPFWKTYRIIRNTLTGRYKRLEIELQNWSKEPT